MLITFGIAFFGGQIVGLIAKLPFFLPPAQNDRKPNKPVLEFGNRCTAPHRTWVSPVLGGLLTTGTYAFGEAAMADLIRFCERSQPKGHTALCRCHVWILLLSSAAGVPSARLGSGLLRIMMRSTPMRRDRAASPGDASRHPASASGRARWR